MVSLLCGGQALPLRLLGDSPSPIVVTSNLVGSGSTDTDHIEAFLLLLGTTVGAAWIARMLTYGGLTKQARYDIMVD